MKTNQKLTLVMYPNTHGIGYVICEGPDEIIDFGLKKVQSISNSEGIKFYPNPFSTQLNFEFQSEYNPIQITIIDILGRNVLTTTVQTSNKSILLDLPFLSDSKYVISLIGQNLNFQTKIIKKL